jgi:hypothetical protein
MGMTPHRRRAPLDHTAPSKLRPIIMLARMRAVLPPDQLINALRASHPPVDPAGAGWAALCAAVDDYELARVRVDTAAHALISPSGGQPEQAKSERAKKTPPRG